MRVGQCYRPRFRRSVFFVLSFVLLACTASAWAQSFVVRGTCSKAQRNHLTLTIYDGDSTFRTMKCVAVDTFRFEGSVSKAAVATLGGGKMNGTLLFYIEPSEITITLDFDNPSASRINGSRANSQYRYLLENCREGGARCLLQYVADNPASPFAPLLLYDHLSALPIEDADRLCRAMKDEAAHAYHYHLLRRRVADLLSVTEGSRMPDFVFVDSAGREVHSDSLMNGEGCMALLVSASWCSTCRSAERVLQSLPDGVIRQTILIDRQPQRWDAPCLRALVIDHIPYIILIDSHGNIVERDLRHWELLRRLKEYGCR